MDSCCVMSACLLGQYSLRRIVIVDGNFKCPLFGIIMYVVRFRCIVICVCFIFLRNIKFINSIIRTRAIVIRYYSFLVIVKRFVI